MVAHKLSLGHKFARGHIVAYDVTPRTITTACYLPHISIEKLLSVIIMGGRDRNIKAQLIGAGVTATTANENKHFYGHY